MQAGVKFCLQNHHDSALNLDTGQAFKGIGDNFDRIMGLAARRGPRMTGMFCAVIGDFQLNRLKSFSQKLMNP